MAEHIDDVSMNILREHFPLHLACLLGDEACVKRLLWNGAFDVFQEDGLRSWTPMHWAAAGGHWKCLAVISEIMEIGMDVLNVRIAQTPAHVAAIACQLECLAWLVQKGFSPGMQDYLGDTPLHKAARAGSLECVKLLTSYDPSLSIHNYAGNTPLDTARESGHEGCVQFLEQAALSQHSSFLPTTSSPILMNGEDIYQRQHRSSLSALPLPEGGGAADMEMDGEDMVAAGDAPPALLAVSGVKRSFDESVEDEGRFKRQRLFAPTRSEKLGTVSNNNVLSSYNAVLAMSAEPRKMETHAVHSAMQESVPPVDVQVDGKFHTAPSEQPPIVVNSNSAMEHFHSRRAEISYESLMMDSLIPSDHGQ